MKILKQNFLVFSIILTLFIFLGETSFLFSQVQKKKPDEIIKVPLLEQMGVIKGIVTDDEYNALPGVTVEATSPGLKRKSSTKTDEEGHFQLSKLPLGFYEVTFSVPGFKTVKRKGIINQSGSTFDSIVTMELATIEEHVTTVVVSPTFQDSMQIVEKWATLEYVTTMETILSKANKDITRKIENLIIFIKTLQETTERQAEDINAIKNSIENLDVRLKKIYERRTK